MAAEKVKRTVEESAKVSYSRLLKKAIQHGRRETHD